MPDSAAIEAVRRASEPPSSLSSLADSCAHANYVLIGEASHGTHEFYKIRADLTRELIERHGYHAVAVEADWPDAHRVNRYVRGRSTDESPAGSLSDFVRFPRWMWRNRVVEEFIDWMRNHNHDRKRNSPEVGFYGIDLYSLNTSRAEVIGYLERVDPAAARRARERYGCFDHFGGDEQAYGMATGYDIEESCEQKVVQQLVDLQRRAFEYMHRDGLIAEDDFFSAEQNARLVRNAEEYYRSMFRGRVSTWNQRDLHMADTIDELSAHLARRFGKAKIVVWAHNSHLGDARATEMSRRGEHNVGQLVRQRHPTDTFLIGFTTWSGTVTAASDWGGDAETRRVRNGLPGSWETLFHEVGQPAFTLDLRKMRNTAELKQDLLERAIGVIYAPATERISHYFFARLPEQFDAVIHVDTTRALEPLDVVAAVEAGDTAETFPSGF